MRSLRLDDELNTLVAAAAAVRGETVSEFIRAAAAERADATLGARTHATPWDDVVGVVRTSGDGVAHRTSEAFADALADPSPPR